MLLCFLLDYGWEVSTVLLAVFSLGGGLSSTCLPWPRRCRYTIYGHGIYLDQATSDVVVRGNAVHSCLAAAFYQHFGRNNTITNNVFALSTGGTGLLWQLSDPSFGPSNLSLVRNIAVVSANTGRS